MSFKDLDEMIWGEMLDSREDDNEAAAAEQRYLWTAGSPKN